MLSSLAGYSSFQRVLPVFIDAALKGALLVLIAAIAAYLLRNRSAASRHAVWTSAVVGHLTIPVLALLLPAWTMPLLPAASWMQSEPAVSTASVSPAQTTYQAAIPVAAPPHAVPAQTNVGLAEGTGAVPASRTDNAAGTQAMSPKRAATTVSLPPITIVALLWFAGALAVLLRLAVGTWRVGQLARDGARVEDGVWLSLTQRLANRLGVSRPLTLLRGERLAVPVTWGIVYPAVLLPQDADNWSEERRRFVLVHEMAHVKRFDALTQLLAQISIALFWFDPLVWVASHRMRVEREHACDDYVLRDGTAPSLYAGELLEMVRSIGTLSHDSAAPAFAALAMARRSEFEGRMLSILDPRIDRKNLNRRGTLMTAVIVALLTFPLAALRPFQPAAAAKDEFPESFKVTFSESPAASPQSVDGRSMGGDTALRVSTSGALTSSTGTTTAQASTSSKETLPSVTTPQSPWSCETSYWAGKKGQQISVHTDSNTQLVEYVSSTGGRCAEAAVIGPIKFSTDEKHIAQLAPGGFARFRERTGTTYRSVSVTPVGDGSLSYSAVVDGKSVPFLGPIQSWFEAFLPEVLREAAINVPERVARIRSESGVAGVLREIRRIQSTGARRAHYEALLKGAPLSDSEGEMVLNQASLDLKDSSGDLSAVLQQMPRALLRMRSSLGAMGTALSSIHSSGDRVNTLQILAPNADNETLVVLAKAAESLPSDGDKANFLMTTAAEYLGSDNEGVRSSFFRAANTIKSSGDLSNVLISAAPYGHSKPSVTFQIIESSRNLSSSGDVANVLLTLSSQGLLQPSTPAATLAVITRTLTMESSGDRANVLMSLPGLGLLSTREVRDAFAKAALALPSEEDRANVLASGARK